MRWNILLLTRQCSGTGVPANVRPLAATLAMLAMLVLASAASEPAKSAQAPLKLAPVAALSCSLPGGVAAV